MSVEELRNMLDEIGAPRHAPPNPQQMRENIANLLGPLQASQAHQAMIEARRQRTIRNAQLLLEEEEEDDDDEGGEGTVEQDSDQHQNDEWLPNPNFAAALGIGNCCNVVTHELGHFDATCKYCGALHWIEEKLKKSPM